MEAGRYWGNRTNPFIKRRLIRWERSLIDRCLLESINAARAVECYSIDVFDGRLVSVYDVVSDIMIVYMSIDTYDIVCVSMRR